MRINFLFGPLQAKKNAFEHPQNVLIYIILHMRSPIRAFTLHLNILLYPMIVCR